jgi:signal transduction histidine kinase
LNARPASRPSFFWQGVLIVLPAAALAGFGLVALRQDRVLVHQQAAEQARKLADHAVQVLLPSALEVAPPAPIDIRGMAVLPARPAEDLVLAYANRAPGWAVCLAQRNGDLIYPLPEGLLLPTEVANPALDAARQAKWAQAQALDVQGNDPTEASTNYQRFLAEDPPEWFAAQAVYRLGVLSARTGRSQAARDYFERVRREFPEALSESGVPLALYAGLHLLGLSRESIADTPSRTQLLDSTCAEAVCRFPLLAPALLDRLEVDGSSGQSQAVIAWRQVLEAQQRARRIDAAWQRALREEAATKTKVEDDVPRWIDLGLNEAWLVLSAPSGSNVWLMALPETSTAGWAKAALSALALPSYFGVQLGVAGRTLPGDQGEEMAVANLEGSRTRPSAEVSVRLTLPELLYGRQRARTYWFGGLIGFSSLTMLIGFLAARRAFWRQRELSDLKSNFVSSVSHELRAPIASVRLMAEELNDIAEADPDKSRTYHGFIMQECRRLSALIENVLDFSRHEQGRKQYQFESTDLPALIDATAKLMRTYAAEKQIAITTQLQAEPIEIEADGRALQQVLVNLIDNAIKHSPAGSTITMGLDSIPATGALGPRSNMFWGRFSSFLSGHRSRCPAAILRLWVEDQGEGIPIQEQARIFEQFYRLGSELRRETQGVGLGLAIVKYVTEAHGGSVSVRSAVGQGSRFTIELPLPTQPNASESPQSYEH